MKVLLIEDDPAIRIALTDYLTSHACLVAVATRLAEADALIGARPAVIVLDWMLPDGDGVAWLRRLRAAGDETPVVLLTARAELSDKVLGLEIGADDYLTKPFEPRELLARLHAHTRPRGRAAPIERLASSGVELDLVTMEVRCLGRLVALTQMELKLLRFFLENPMRALSRDKILESVWGLRYPTTRTVDVHVMQLRQKLRPELFETMHGLGYRFRPDDGA